MKNCRCLQDCGCFLSDNMTVGNIGFGGSNINNVPFNNQQMIPNTLWLDNKHIDTKQYRLRQYSVDELIDEIKRRDNISVHMVSADDSVEVISIIVRK